MKPREETAELAALCGGGEPSITNAIETVRTELEVLYEALSLNGEQWAADVLHGVQFRLGCIARLARDDDASPL